MRKAAGPSSTVVYHNRTLVEKVKSRDFSHQSLWKTTSRTKKEGQRAARSAEHRH